MLPFALLLGSLSLLLAPVAPARGTAASIAAATEAARVDAPDAALEHLERALAYGAASDTFPEGERFVWHPEGLWAVESYLATHAPAERARLIEGIRRGWIHLDGLFANLLTGLGTEEGFARALEAGRRLSAVAGRAGVPALWTERPRFPGGSVAQSDDGSRVLFEKMIQDEERHVDFLEAQLGMIKELGLGNYLAQQMHA